MCCSNCDLAKKADVGNAAPVEAYDAAHGKYKAAEPRVTGGANKAGPKPFKGAK